MTLNLSEAKNHDCRHHPRGSVRRASGFVLNGQTGSNAQDDSQRRVPEVGFWKLTRKAVGFRPDDSKPDLSSEPFTTGFQQVTCGIRAVSSVHRNAHREADLDTVEVVLRKIELACFRRQSQVKISAGKVIAIDPTRLHRYYTLTALLDPGETRSLESRFERYL